MYIYNITKYRFSLPFGGMNKGSVTTPPTTMRPCSLSGRIIQSPPSNQLQEEWYMTARGWQSVDELTTKDTGKIPCPPGLHSKPTDPPAIPLMPCPCTDCFFLLERPALPLLCLPYPYSLTPSSAPAPAESSPCAHPTPAG